MTFWPAKSHRIALEPFLIAEFRKGSVLEGKCAGKKLRYDDGETGPKTFKPALIETMIELFRKLQSPVPGDRPRAESISRTGAAPVQKRKTESKKRSNVDLQDFVTTTLCQISAGVATAKNYDRCVAPRVDVGERDPKILRTFGTADGVFLVEFDVAVTISDASENGDTTSILVLSPPAPKPKTKGGIENSSVNRLKFTVPIAYR